MTLAQVRPTTPVSEKCCIFVFCGMLYFLELNLGRINLARMTLLNVKIFISSNFMYFYPLLSIFNHHHHGHLRHYGHCSPHGHHSHQNPHWLFFFFGNVCQSVCISSKMDSNICRKQHMAEIFFIFLFWDIFCVDLLEKKIRCKIVDKVKLLEFAIPRSWMLALLLIKETFRVISNHLRFKIHQRRSLYIFILHSKPPNY